MSEKKYAEIVDNVSNRNRNAFIKYVYAILEIDGCDISDVESISFNEKTLKVDIFYFQ